LYALNFHFPNGERRGFDRMVVAFTTTCAIGVYPYYSGEVYSMQQYVIKFVS